MSQTSPGPAPREVSVLDLDRLVDGWHHDPHSILGPHSEADVVTIRVLRPGAEAVTLVTPDGRFPLAHEHRGVWVVALAGTVGARLLRRRRVRRRRSCPATTPTASCPRSATSTCT